MPTARGDGGRRKEKTDEIRTEVDEGEEALEVNRRLSKMVGMEKSEEEKDTGTEGKMMMKTRNKTKKERKFGFENEMAEKLLKKDKDEEAESKEGTTMDMEYVMKP